MAIAGFAMVLVRPSPSPVALLVAGGLLVAIAVAVALAPWDRLPPWMDAVPPLLFMLVVGLLRDSQGGNVSGYSTLLLVPVVWLALYGRREEVGLAVVGVALVLAAPLLAIGGASYPPSEWRRVVVITAVAGLVGWATYSTVEVLRRQTRDISLVQRATMELSRLHTVEEVVAILLESAAVIGSTDARTRRAQVFRIDGDEVEIVAEHDDSGTSALGFRFPLADHPWLPDVVTTGEVRRGELRPDDLPGDLGVAIRRVGVTESVYAPLAVDGQLFGVVGVASRRGPFTADRVARIVTLVSIGSIALTNAFAHDRLTDENLALSEAADRDPLTGVANRRAWDRALADIEARPPSQRRSIDVGIIDLDHFKAYNDAHGHPAGDRLLCAAAAAWCRVLRKGDLLARIGGEEFAFLLVDAEPGLAAEVAERLRTSVPTGASCSIGIARRRGDEPLTEAMARADRSLYDAKSAGRDRVVTAAP